MIEYYIKFIYERQNRRELKKENLLLEHLKHYQKSDMYPFHMPGHKRCKNKFTDEFLNPFEIDITEIEGFDNLHHPEGILKNSMEWAAKVYGADKTYYLINGSSSGILSAVCGTSSLNGKIIMSRNCHKSVYHGVILNHLRTEYIYPQIIENLWINGGILLDDMEKVLENNLDASAVLIVSPSYDGIVSDIRGIAEIVHKRGIPLIVDEAHGAHFSFDIREKDRFFPKSALDCGADIVIQSLHKTLPSFTQTAVMHVRKGYINLERLEWYLQVYQSSSPSYVLMAGIEKCIYEMKMRGMEYYKRLEKEIAQMRKSLSKMKCLYLLDKEVIGHFGVYDIDYSKIVVSCQNTILSGTTLGKLLREKYHLEMEMCGVDYVVAITTCFDSQEGLCRLTKALLEIDEMLFQDSLKEKQKGNAEMKNIKSTWQKKNPEACMSLARAREKKWKRYIISECEGKISAEFIYLYPPGIPIIVPGERIDREIINQILQYKKMGLPIQGMEDKASEYLMVCTEE